MKTLRERFEAKIKLDPETGCLMWTAGVDTHGYGQIYVGEPGCRSRTAHRVAWEFVNGAIAIGMHVLHHCDTPRCVNVDHLFLGTHQDNMRDRDSKGRQSPIDDRRVWGETVGTSKLTAADVGTIRARLAMGHKHTIIAKDHGVCRQTIDHIAAGRTWRDPLAACAAP